VQIPVAERSSVHRNFPPSSQTPPLVRQPQLPSTEAWSGFNPSNPRAKNSTVAQFLCN